MITLTIETAFRGGSLSLIKNNREIDFWIGNKNVSKAEDVLDQISLILKRNRIKVIDLVAVSEGPGSLTGIRIGLATALGLAKSYNSEIVKVSIFEALMSEITEHKTLLAITIGRGQVAWMIFEEEFINSADQMPEINTGDLRLFLKQLEKQFFSKIIVQSEIKEIILGGENIVKSNELSVIKNNISFYVGLKAIHKNSPKKLP